MAIYRSDGATIRNNVCYQNGVRAGAGEVSVLGNQALVHNNIFVPRMGRLALELRYNQPAYVVDAATLMEDANILWASDHTDVVAWADGAPADVMTYKAQNAHGWGASTLFVDPALVSPSTHDFHVNKGSPAVDSGDPGHAASEDITFAARPWDGDGDGKAIVDRGAYELGAMSGSGSSGSSGGGAGSGGDGGGGGSSGPTVSCGCRMEGDGGAAGGLAAFALVIGIAARRRQNVTRR